MSAAISLAGLLASEQVTIGWHTRVPPAWEFDCAAIASAARELGVRGRIEVGCAEYANGRWGGMYSYERGVHRIRVKRASRAEYATRILWHELTHAAQHERGDTAGTRALGAGTEAYRNHPKEVEARATEEANAHRPLVRA